MASYQLKAASPPVTLDAGCTITFEAIDPNTGATVTGVAVTTATIYADNSSFTPITVERTPMFGLDPLV